MNTFTRHAGQQADVLFERSGDGSVLHVILNRVSKRNAISPAMAKQIRTALEDGLAQDTHLIVIRSAADGVFCAGFDIANLEDRGSGDPAAPLYDLYRCLERLPQITLAFGDGLVVGGGVELFLCCDLRLASPRTTFRMPPARLSIVYEREGIARFIRRAGVAATSELFLAGRTLTAAEAQSCGLATRVLAAGEMDAYCTEVRQGAPLAQRAMKEIILSLCTTAATEGDSAERFVQLKQMVLQSADHAEALAAFREKRSPRFQGK